MVAKNWRRLGGSSNQYGETFFYKKEKDYVVITGDKNPNSKGFYRWRVQTSKYGDNNETKEFKTKSQSLKFARNYMRKN